MIYIIHRLIKVNSLQTTVFGLQTGKIDDIKQYQKKILDEFHAAEQIFDRDGGNSRGDVGHGIRNDQFIVMD